jgi:uncharacterized membrane protein/uncharacterized protein YhhL (DUF1145 family)
MRGLAVVIMIQCHVFNSLTRLDVRDGGPYIISQFIGGMAAPLFLFMAGMTTAFLMDGMERREVPPVRRWLLSLRHAGYILVIAFLFRFTNWAASYPNGQASELTKVDILNCMGVAMLVFSAAALFGPGGRLRFAVAAATAIAGLSPFMANLDWSGMPTLLHEYLAAGTAAARGRFSFFPCAAYLGFGMAAGFIVRRAAAERIERVMQWSVLVGFTGIFVAQYLSNVPYSIYAKSNFWTDNPTLIFIRTGIALLMLAGSYVWTEFVAAPGFSWIECLGKNSLMVYWVHVMLVYGNWVRPIKRTLSIPLAVLATAIVILMMVALSVLWLRWKARRALTTSASNSPASKGWTMPFQPRRKLG